MADIEQTRGNDPLESRIAEFRAAEAERSAASSPARPEPAPAEITADREINTAAAPEVSPVFKELSEPKLPELERTNRARLQMQSPNRLYFYWSIKEDPFQTLRNAFGGEGNYLLVAKLVDVDGGTDEVNRIGREGSWWFDVEAGREYRVEIGLYSPSRPFIRVMFSNAVRTPAKRPSAQPASTAEWHVSADKFADVLNVSGFRSDAFDVALVGDDRPAADAASLDAFAKLTGRDANEVEFGIAGEDIRYVLFAIAAGIEFQELRHRIGPKLFAELERRAAELTSERAKNAIREGFGTDSEEFIEEVSGAEVFGSSLINFPRRYKRTRKFGGPEPLSSFHLGSR